MASIFSSLRWRLILLVLLALLPALGLILYSGVEQRREAALAAQENALQLVRHMAMEQEHMIQGTEQLLATLAQLPAIQGPHDQAAISDFLARLLRQNPLYANIAFLKPDGDIGI